MEPQARSATAQASILSLSLRTSPPPLPPPGARSPGSARCSREGSADAPHTLIMTRRLSQCSTRIIRSAAGASSAEATGVITTLTHPRGTLALSELPAQHRSLLSELSRPPSDAEGTESRDAPVRDQEFSHLGGSSKRGTVHSASAAVHHVVAVWRQGPPSRAAPTWRLQAYEARRRWTQAAAEAGARLAHAQQCSPPWPSPAPLRRAPPRSSP